MARVIFMGTPQFAVPILQALDRHQQVVGVVTQPDRFAGRGRKMAVSPVKEEASRLGLQLFQPSTLRTPEAVAQLASWQPDVIVVAAFGQILQPTVLKLPQRGCLNVHASLLPRWRGAAPIPAAILAGETATGVTIMRMDEGLDTGSIIAQAELGILPDDTTMSLTHKLSHLGAQLAIEALPGWLAGIVPTVPQDEELATYCRPMTKADGLIDWDQPAVYLDRQVRACDPWPSAYSAWQGQRLKILNAHPEPGWRVEERPGTVIALGPGLGVATGQGFLVLLEVQMAGKRPVAAEAFARGQRDLIGGVLGS